MLETAKNFALAGSPPHYITALGVFAYACLEWWLGRTKFVQSNSALELAANGAKRVLLDRIPLLGRLVKALATPAAVLLVSMLVISGCATTATPVGATIAQKLHDDAAALQQIATDVKAKCGDQFAPVAPLLASLLAVAADPYNAVADLMAALQVIPAIMQDVKGAECVVKTIRDDVRALKPLPPAAAPHALLLLDQARSRLANMLEGPAARVQIATLLDIPQICDSTTSEGSSACRSIDVSDDWPGFTFAVPDMSLAEVPDGGQ